MKNISPTALPKRPGRPFPTILPSCGSRKPENCSGLLRLKAMRSENGGLPECGALYEDVQKRDRMHSGTVSKTGRTIKNIQRYNTKRREKPCVLLRFIKNSNDRSKTGKSYLVPFIKKTKDMKWRKYCTVVILSLVNSNKTFFHKEEENV